MEVSVASLDQLLLMRKLERMVLFLHTSFGKTCPGQDTTDCKEGKGLQIVTSLSIKIKFVFFLDRLIIKLICQRLSRKIQS